MVRRLIVLALLALACGGSMARTQQAGNHWQAPVRVAGNHWQVPPVG